MTSAAAGTSGRCHWFVSVSLRTAVTLAVAAATDPGNVTTVAVGYNRNDNGVGTDNNYINYGDNYDYNDGAMKGNVDGPSDHCSGPTPTDRAECGIDNPWYRTSVTCIKIVSALSAFMTMITYMYVLKQLDRINYVKHYAACLTVSMGLNPLEDMLFRMADDRRPDSFELKMFGMCAVTI